MPIADAEVIAAVVAQRAAMAGTVAFVHAHPELAYEEHLCAAHLAGRLGEAGLRVEQGVAGLGTAFRAVLTGGRAGRRVGIAALYDAVAAVREDGSLEAVHSCGHGLTAGALTANPPADGYVASRISRFLEKASEPHATGWLSRHAGMLSARIAGRIKVRQSPIGRLFNYFMQTMLWRPRCISDRCLLPSGWSSAVSPPGLAEISQGLWVAAGPVRSR